MIAIWIVNEIIWRILIAKTNNREKKQNKALIAGRRIFISFYVSTIRNRIGFYKIAGQS